MAAPGKFKRENSRYSYPNFWYIELSLHFLENNYIIDFISNN